MAFAKAILIYLASIQGPGVTFWDAMYIPIIVAMSATQNVKVGLSSGHVAILVGIIPVFVFNSCWCRFFQN